MILAILVSLIAVASSAEVPAVALQTGRDVGCRDARECRAMAEAAAARGEYETFHDLAWRAVQTGRPNDPELMYLLARAQALSGRPHDALVMLDRLAQMGVASDADTNDDFVRTRQLDGWPEVARRIERLRPPAPAAASSPPTPPAPAPPPPVRTPVEAPPEPTPAAPPTPAPPPAPVVVRESPIAPLKIPLPVMPPPPPAATAEAAPAPAPVPSAPTPAPPAATPTPSAAAAPTSTAASPVPASAAPVPRAETVRFALDRAALVGLAYDAVSRRVVFGDRLGRKLVVVSEGSTRPLDLVRAESAGFQNITALEVDGLRGDLWVASTSADGGGTLHQLQMVSGRPLRSFRVPSGSSPVDLADIAVTRSGTVLVLDVGNSRILGLRPRARVVETMARVDAPAPSSITIGSDDTIAYVAHRDGVVQIDLRSRHATPVKAPKGEERALAGLQLIRFHRRALIGVSAAEGSSRILRFSLNANGQSVARATTVDGAAAIAGRACATIAGDDVIYLSAAGSDGETASAGSAGAFVAYRISLR